MKGRALHARRASFADARDRKPEAEAVPDSSRPSPKSPQDRQWSRHAARYDDLFLDPFRPGVVNPLLEAIEATDSPEALTVADLGCGTGPLLPHLIDRFGRVIAIDFAPNMIKSARKRLGEHAERIEFQVRSMWDLETFAGQLDLAVAVNSIVMPDVRDIDRALVAIHRSLKPGGRFLGILPAMDAIHYHTMLLYDRALSQGLAVEEAERQASFLAEHHYYEFAYGRFQFLGLKQKFWQPFEARHRLTKAGFADVVLEQVLYPWDDNIAGYEDFGRMPRSWDWFFSARASEAGSTG